MSVVEAKKYVGKLTDDWVMSCSRLPALMGLSGFSSPSDELRKSIDAWLVSKGREPISIDTPATYGEAASWGNEIEGLILRRMAGRLELRCQLEVTERVEHAELPLQGSLDGILFGDGRTVTSDPSRGIYVVGAESITLDGPGVAEAKLTSSAPLAEPALYRGPIQCQGLMMCGGYRWAAIGTLYRGTELRIYLLAPDPVMQEKIAADVLDFQRRMDLFKRDGVTDWYPALNANDASGIFAKVEPDLPPVTLNDDDSSAVRELIEVKRTIRELTKLVDTLEAQVMDALGLHSTGYAVADGKVVAEVQWGLAPARKEYVVPARKASRAKSLKIKEVV